jgi:hypothetical protein
MTVAYMQFTHTSAKIGVFFRVLRIWKGGILKVYFWKNVKFIKLYLEL